MDKRRACFVIAPIGEQDSDTRKRSDQVLKHIIRPAVEECGYTAERADEMDKPGIITSQVIQRVVNDPLVVADLTERNPNVFYELAIRHAIRKPLVQLIKKGERIPFDVAGTRTIQVDHHDLDSVESAKREIIQQIRSLEGDSGAVETPISVSLDLQLLRQSDKPEERSLADLVGAVSELRSGVGKVETKLPVMDAVQESVRNLAERMDECLGGRLSRRRRRFRFHPMVIDELVHMAGGEVGDAGLVLLVTASFFREDFPWLYELGVEGYRAIKSGDAKRGRGAVRTFLRAAEATVGGPMMEEFGPLDKETRMMLMELPHFVEHFGRRFWPELSDDKDASG